jgi:hypothetical protein
MSKKVVFQVSAEVTGEATSGLLLGDFNQWNHETGFPLKKQNDGSLKVTAELEPGEYQYRYLLNDGRWVNDGNANGYAHDGKYGIENCIIKVETEAKKEPVKAAKTEKVTPVVVTEPIKTAKKPVVKNAPVEAPAKAAKKAPAKAIPAKVAPAKITPAKKEVAAKPVTKKTATAKAEVKKTGAKPIAAAKKTTKKTK